MSVPAASSDTSPVPMLLNVVGVAKALFYGFLLAIPTAVVDGVVGLGLTDLEVVAVGMGLATVAYFVVPLLRHVGTSIRVYGDRTEVDRGLLGGAATIPHQELLFGIRWGHGEPGETVDLVATGQHEPVRVVGLEDGEAVERALEERVPPTDRRGDDVDGSAARGVLFGALDDEVVLTRERVGDLLDVDTASIRTSQFGSLDGPYTRPESVSGDDFTPETSGRSMNQR